MKRITLAVLVALTAIGMPFGVQANDQGLEPEVVITPSKNNNIKEYRVNGQLYMIEIVPKKGPPYFLVDMDGDGLMESRQGRVGTDVLIPRWILLSW
ncbi:DUF2782 domain-containing protein [Pseudomonadota bacterium]